MARSVLDSLDLYAGIFKLYSEKNPSDSKGFLIGLIPASL